MLRLAWLPTRKSCRGLLKPEKVLGDEVVIVAALGVDVEAEAVAFDQAVDVATLVGGCAPDCLQQALHFLVHGKPLFVECVENIL